MLFIGLDVGTSGCKAAVMDEEGAVIRSACADYSLFCPRAGYVELSPELVWSSVKKVLKEVAPYCRDAGYLAVSSIGEALVFLDKEDRPLYNGIIYLDQRCQDMVPEVLGKMDGRELHRISGVPVNQMYSLFKYLWLQKNEPRILEKAKKICLFGDYITYMLSGMQCIDPSTASRTQLFDADAWDWSDVIMDRFQIDRSKFSEVKSTGTILGNIRPVLAEELGISRQIKVVVGCHDQCSATLGAGAIAAGDVMLGEGSTESMNLVASKGELSDALIENGVCFEPYILPEQYLIPMGQLAHGNSIRWFVEKFGVDAPEHTAASVEDLYERANHSCAADAGQVYFLPYLSGAGTTGKDSSALGGFLGLDISVGRDKLYRALLEGLSYETRSNFDLLRSMGFQTGRITASGGCTKSSLLMQMKADILEHSIEILQSPESGVRGLGIICAMAADNTADYEQTVRRFVHIGRNYTPEHDYKEKYSTYRRFAEAIKDLYGAR